MGGEMSLNGIFCDEAITEQIPLMKFLQKAGKVFGSPNIDIANHFAAPLPRPTNDGLSDWRLCGNSMLSERFRTLNRAVSRTSIFGTIIAIRAIAPSVNHFSLLRNLLHVPQKLSRKYSDTTSRSLRLSFYVEIITSWRFQS